MNRNFLLRLALFVSIKIKKNLLFQKNFIICFKSWRKKKKKDREVAWEVRGRSF